MNGPQIVQQCGCGPSAPPSPAGAGPGAQGGAPVPSPASGGPSAGPPTPAGAPPPVPGAAGAPGVTQKVLQASKAEAPYRGWGRLAVCPKSDTQLLTFQFRRRCCIVHTVPLQDIQASLAAAGSVPLELSPPSQGTPAGAGPAPGANPAGPSGASSGASTG